MTVTTTLEPKGKLDAAAAAAVNGPEGGPCGWESVDWLSAEDNVRRLRQRIFTASQAGDFCPPASPRGLLEPDAWKRARPVLRGAGPLPRVQAN
jgi:hypothetical protein